MRTLTLILTLTGAAGASGADLRGALIVAADGTLLGTCDRTSATGVATPGGAYSSDLGVNSLFNRVTPYGSLDGALSASNPNTLHPPYLIAGRPDLTAFFTSGAYQPSAAVARAVQASGGTRVTVNRHFTLRLTPDALRRHCAALP